ncbi:MAG TPA: hypothetical protein VFX03_07795, partial [Thermomicrobiales bacterium]|nr:hypothetical protein [Thermomicrobiales bacterium]
VEARSTGHATSPRRPRSGSFDRSGLLDDRRFTGTIMLTYGSRTFLDDRAMAARWPPKHTATVCPCITVMPDRSPFSRIARKVNCRS